MSPILLLLSAGLSSLFFSFLTHRLFFKRKKFDPINHRSSHNSEATRSGGGGIMSTLFCISLFHYFYEVLLFDYSLLIPLSIMFITGVYDDFYNADFKIKFFLQIIVAKILIDQGYVIDQFYGILGLEQLPWFAAQLFTIFVFLVVINAINFIDGIDGLALSVTLYILIAYVLLNQNSPLIGFCTLCIGALLPLFYFNFRKHKKVFLGDGGSLLLGTVCCILIFDLLNIKTSLSYGLSINKAYLSILILAYPLTDLLRVFIIRIGQKKSPFLPDNNHLHHTLLRKIKSHAGVTGSITLFAMLFLSLHLFTSRYTNDLYLVLFDIVILFFIAKDTIRKQ